MAWWHVHCQWTRVVQAPPPWAVPPWLGGLGGRRHWPRARGTCARSSALYSQLLLLLLLCRAPLAALRHVRRAVRAAHHY